MDILYKGIETKQEDIFNIGAVHKDILLELSTVVHVQLDILTLSAF